MLNLIIKYNVSTKAFIISFIMVLCVINPLHAQKKIVGGPFAGVSWYNGDLNPQKQFYNMHPAIGGILRYAVNDRIAFRAGLQYVGISGQYPQDDIYFPETYSEPYSFDRNMLDFSTLLELNFFSFDHPHDSESFFTPYLALGVATTFYKRYSEEDGNHSEKSVFVLSLPFGAGVKWKVNDRIQLGAEWTFRKSFTDDLDVVGHELPVDPSDPFGFDSSSLMHNNDWYSIVGIYATFTLFSERKKCYDGFHNRRGNR